MAALIVLIIAKFSFTKEEINVLMPSLVGVVLIWFSYPVTFILASVALYYLFALNYSFTALSSFQKF